MLSMEVVHITDESAVNYRTLKLKTWKWERHLPLGKRTADPLKDLKGIFPERFDGTLGLFDGKVDLKLSPDAKPIHSSCTEPITKPRCSAVPIPSRQLPVLHTITTAHADPPECRSADIPPMTHLQVRLRSGRLTQKHLQPKQDMTLFSIIFMHQSRMPTFWFLMCQYKMHMFYFDGYI